MRAFTGPTWRDEFNMFEMRFFSIPADQWRAVSQLQIQQINQNYDATTHRIHVAALNQLLRPFPLLDEADFDKKIALTDLRDRILADRMTPTPTGVVTLNIDMPAKDIRDAGLGHLLQEPRIDRVRRRRRR